MNGSRWGSWMVVASWIAVAAPGCSSSSDMPPSGSDGGVGADGGGVRTDGAVRLDGGGGGGDGSVATDGGGGGGGDAGGGTPGACTAPLVSCGGSCVDVSASATDCGACGSACAAPMTCVAGVCGMGGGMTCPTGYVSCGGGGGGGGMCVDVSADPQNCGACGNGCNDTEACVDGTCQCRPGLSLCGSTCVDRQADPMNCGTCGTTCMGATSACVAGVCSMPSSCTAGAAPMVCDGACVDTDTSVLHCGGCGIACGADQLCTGGECIDYRPAVGCTTCGTCTACTGDFACCDVAGYGVNCVAVEGGACP